jgi:hypothetical protein
MDWAKHFKQSSQHQFGADANSVATVESQSISHIPIVEQVIAGVVVLIIGSLAFALFRSEETEIKYLRSRLNAR